MRLHNSDIDIGEVVFETDAQGTQQRVEAHLSADPSQITPGRHGFHIHTGPVGEGNNCGPDATGGHYNPRGVAHGDFVLDNFHRHVGDFGNVEAGERGEVNHQMNFEVDSASNGFSMSQVGRSAVYCEDHIAWKVWKNGKRERLPSLQDIVPPLVTEEWVRYKTRRGKSIQKICNKRQIRRGMCQREMVLPKYTIEVTENDCYVPMSQRLNIQLSSPRFLLSGAESVVGRAVVLHGGEDDLGQGGDAGSAATGNAGPRIACCTLELQDDRN